MTCGTCRGRGERRNTHGTRFRCPNCGSHYIESIEAIDSTWNRALASRRSNGTTADIDSIKATDETLDAIKAHRAAFEQFIDAYIAFGELFQFHAEQRAGTFDHSERFGALVEAFTEANEAAADALQPQDAMHHRAAVAFHQTVYTANCR